VSAIGQSVHRESRIHAGAEHGHPGPFGQRIDLLRDARVAFTGYASSSVVETMGTFNLSTASNSGEHFFQ
jgi:hypothetical protein